MSQPEREYRPGDRADFDRLYRDAYPRIFATLVTLLRDRAAAEDCAQDAFLRAYRAWPRFKAEAPPAAWVHRIAVNGAISHRRKEKLREVGELVRRLGRPHDPDPVEEASLRPDLTAALRALPAKHAAAVILRHLHGYSNREIAYILGIPAGTVASRLSRAREMLRERLEPENRETGWNASADLRVPTAEANR
jgi:RNA polymerase sigma-70 factor (ECF subfamily)